MAERGDAALLEVRDLRVHFAQRRGLFARRVPPVMAQVLNDHLKGFSEEEWQQLLALLTRMKANGDALRG